MNSHHSVGSVSEHKAAIYFLEKGCEVYWPSSSQAKADFVVETPEREMVKVQVKTASRSVSGGIEYIQVRVGTTHRKGATYKEGDFDALAVVYEEKMWLIPYQEIVGMSSICIGRLDGKVSDRMRARFNVNEYIVKE